MISESTLTSEHYFFRTTQRSGKKTIYGQALVNPIMAGPGCPATTNRQTADLRHPKC
jgi:hypothetical protein